MRLGAPSGLSSSRCIRMDTKVEMPALMKFQEYEDRISDMMHVTDDVFFFFKRQLGKIDSQKKIGGHCDCRIQTQKEKKIVLDSQQC